MNICILDEFYYIFRITCLHNSISSLSSFSFYLLHTHFSQSLGVERIVVQLSPNRFKYFIKMAKNCKIALRTFCLCRPNHKCALFLNYTLSITSVITFLNSCKYFSNSNFTETIPIMSFTIAKYAVFLPCENHRKPLQFSRIDNCTMFYSCSS